MTDIKHMKLVIDCPNCREPVVAGYHEDTRPYLADAVGGKITFRCPECGTTRTVHVNQVRATANYLPVYLAAGVGLLLAAFLWQYGFVAVLPFALPILVNQVQQSGVNTFNQYKLRR